MEAATMIPWNVAHGYLPGSVCLLGTLWYVHLLIGGGEVEAKLRLQEETIFDLKQQLSTMMWRFEDLNYKHEELKSQLSLMPIKSEGKFLKVDSMCMYMYQDLFCMIAVEEKPAILGHQQSLPPIKGEGDNIIHLSLK